MDSATITRDTLLQTLKPFTKPRASTLRKLSLPEGAGRLCLTAALFVVGVVLCLSSGMAVTEVMDGFSYNTLVLIIAMQIFTDILAQTGIMEWCAVRLAELSGGRQTALIASLGAMMFLISSVLNNITAVLCILPATFVLLRAICPNRRFLLVFFSILLASSNLGGAATGVSDLPSILIIATGVTSFAGYSMRAFPFFATCTAIVIVCWLVCLKLRGGKENRESANLAVKLLKAQYRYVRVDSPTLIPLLCVLGVMITAWIVVPGDVMGSETIAVLGCVLGCAAFRLKGGRVSQTIDLGSVLVIAGFLFVAQAIGASGVLDEAALVLRFFCPDDKSFLLAVLFLASILSGLLGAGPAAAIALPIVVQLATGPFAAQADWLMVAYGASICAGSSLLLSSATAGFLLSGKVESAAIKDDRSRLFVWGFREYLTHGFVNYAIQMSLAMALVWIAF